MLKTNPTPKQIKKKVSKFILAHLHHHSMKNSARRALPASRLATDGPPFLAFPKSLPVAPCTFANPRAAQLEAMRGKSQDRVKIFPRRRSTRGRICPRSSAHRISTPCCTPAGRPPGIPDG